MPAVVQISDQPTFIGRNVASAREAMRDLQDGTSLHGLSDGSWSLSDAIMAILQIVGPSDVAVATWTMGREEISLTRSQLQTDLFQSFRLMVDRSFVSRQPDYCEAVRSSFGDSAIRTWSAHAKFAIFTGGAFDVLYLTSANLNRNARLENFSAFAGGQLPAEYLAMVNELYSIQSPSEGFDNPSAGRTHTDMVQGKTRKPVEATPKHKQHVDIHRKLAHRKRLLRMAEPGAAYVPFIGDGDIAVELYSDRTIYGADLDPERVAIAAGRINGTIIAADCDSWPFAGHTIAEPFAVADFDSYSYPYHSFRTWWESDAPRRDRLVLFFTDGQSRTVSAYKGALSFSDGLLTPMVVRSVALYWRRHVLPPFADFIAPWTVVKTANYTRRNMVYWGAVIER